MNFAFLEEFNDLTSLLRYCTECESFAQTAPDISITAARKAVEYLVKLLYGTKINPCIHGLSLFDILSDYDFSDYINDQNIVDSIHVIRKKGNLAVHEGNLSVEDAASVLKELHYVVGELCIKLGIIATYPTFDPRLSSRTEHSFPATISGEPDVDEALIRRVSQLIRGRMKPVAYANTQMQIIDVHTKARKSADLSGGTDCGANGKAAYQQLSGLIGSWFPEAKILMQSVRSEIHISYGNKSTVLAVKTGCGGLGTKSYDGQWEMLPGIDFVLYAPDIVPGTPMDEQFYLFSKDEFIRFWEGLGLLRFKVSGGMRKKLIQQFGADVKISTEEHADVISIQSFTNSGRKLPLVKNGLAERPHPSKAVLSSIL